VRLLIAKPTINTPISTLCRTIYVIFNAGRLDFLHANCNAVVPLVFVGFSNARTIALPHSLIAGKIRMVFRAKFYGGFFVCGVPASLAQLDARGLRLELNATAWQSHAVAHPGRAWESVAHRLWLEALDRRQWFSRTCTASLWRVKAKWIAQVVLGRWIGVFHKRTRIPSRFVPRKNLRPWRSCDKN